MISTVLFPPEKFDYFSVFVHLNQGPQALEYSHSLKLVCVTANYPSMHFTSASNDLKSALQRRAAQGENTVLDVEPKNKTSISA